MEDQFQLLFDNMKIEMQKQTTELTNTLTTELMNKMEEKLQPVLEENKILKLKVENLEKKVEYLERDKKNNNLIIHGLKEEEKSTPDLLKMVKQCFSEELNITLEEYEVNKIYRIGNTNKDGKPKPTLLSLTCGWKKNEIMKNKKKLKECYITEDYPKEVLEKRRSLQPKLNEERKKGHLAYIKYDKLIVKENKNVNEKRKREISTSPQTEQQPRKQTMTTSKTNRINAFDMMRARSHSLSTCPSTKEQ